MTFSLVARCPRTGQLGVAACTAMAGVGKLVAHAEARVGAVATQADINPYYGLDGIKMLRDRVSPAEVLRGMVDRDPDAARRQVGMIDREGRMAAWTGSDTPHWSGHRLSRDVAAQGNRLVGPETLVAAIQAFEVYEHESLARRLLRALDAGERTGSDRKGAHSATVYVVDTEEYPLWDLRIDGAWDPVHSLWGLYRTFRKRLVPMIKQGPKRGEPAGDLYFAPPETAAGVER